MTGYADSVPHGGAFGMNRLNHCAAIFEEGWRSGDRRLLETAVLWCDNFFDQTIWWGEKERGGTRYNNIVAMNKTPPTKDYMWRSDSSVNFCTKGYDAFWLARVYRPARPAQDALAELRRMSGSQFCPRCTAALEAIVATEIESVPQVSLVD